jgi:hypothetical protein
MAGSADRIPLSAAQLPHRIASWTEELRSAENKESKMTPYFPPDIKFPSKCGQGRAGEAGRACVR